MIGGDHVDGAVLDAFDQRLAVLLAAEGRVHLEIAAFLQVALIQDQIVRRGLASDVNAFPFCPADQLDTFPGGNVANVERSARLLGKHKVTLDLLVFAGGANAPVPVRFGVFAVVDISALQKVVDFAVRGDDLAKFLCLDHRAAHHILALYPSSVIRKRNGFLGKPRHIGKLLALLAFGDRRIGIDRYGCVFCDDIQLRFQRLFAIRHRGQIGHRTHRGISAVRRRHRPGLDGLLIRKTRLSEVHVHITETGKNNVFFVAVQSLFFHTNGKKRVKTARIALLVIGARNDFYVGQILLFFFSVFHSASLTINTPQSSSGPSITTETFSCLEVGMLLPI